MIIANKRQWIECMKQTLLVQTRPVNEDRLCWLRQRGQYFGKSARCADLSQMQTRLIGPLGRMFQLKNSVTKIFMGLRWDRRPSLFFFFFFKVVVVVVAVVAVVAVVVAAATVALSFIAMAVAVAVGCYCSCCSCCHCRGRRRRRRHIWKGHFHRQSAVVTEFHASELAEVTSSSSLADAIEARFWLVP